MVIKQFRYHFKGWPCTWRPTVHWNAWTRVVVPLHMNRFSSGWSHAATFGVQSYIVVFVNPHYRRRRQDISFLHGQSHLCQWNRPRFGIFLGEVKTWPGKMPNMFSQDKSSGFPYSKRPSTHSNFPCKLEARWTAGSEATQMKSRSNCRRVDLSGRNAPMALTYLWRVDGLSWYEVPKIAEDMGLIFTILPKSCPFILGKMGKIYLNG